MGNSEDSNCTCDGRIERHRIRAGAMPDAARALWAGTRRRRRRRGHAHQQCRYLLHGGSAEQDVDAIERLVTLNVTAVTNLTRLALPSMLSRQDSRILNVASLAAYQPAGLREAAYHASPAFVWSFTKGVARELRGSGNVGATPRQFIKMPFLTMS